ncbi:hypothetical protein SAMD00019534_083780 [Acytostelium subglobosum LB1]|uniref:hypothetical protein n=1 Tax=Acytostelium subglobosum LB1 TaxID=1410327 RepID=UPI000644E036|nr:hypothetical protein SAMD00019534_083780 [Acytostelium subglobosum LB1]GAM25203.1 hypothetical protein SAMD00019534_083780 [Acytostelium subglobosum LB1]|eukprot:XP_012751723.1 hypothetical protein SAMD00019534_083780 [Acytostelium subglobosum LB1]
MIIACNLAFSFVEKPSFKMYTALYTPLATLPSPDTVRVRLTSMFGAAVSKLINHFKSNNSLLSFCLDGWTSRNCLGFIGITCHWIDATFKPRNVLLTMTKIDITTSDGKHSGLNIADAFFIAMTLQRYCITDRCLATISDNASNNFTFSKSLKEILDARKLPYKGLESHIGCTAHIVNLVVQEFIKGLEACTVLSKLHGIAVAIRGSPQRRESYKFDYIPFGNKDRIKLPKMIVVTRWNSQYLVLERALAIRATLERVFTQKEYAEYALGKDEWELARTLFEVLQPFYRVTLEVSHANANLSIAQQINRGGVHAYNSCGRFIDLESNSFLCGRFGN